MPPSDSPLLVPRNRANLSPLGGFIDQVFQMFEDCRPGLPDDAVRAGEQAVQGYFLDLYEKEVPRLRDHIHQHAAHLTASAAEALSREVDRLVRTVILPAYVRLSCRQTSRERNDFYLTPENAHVAERIGWALSGALIGGFVVWAPFIPLWSKEWVLPFFVGGLFFPELRRYFALKRYEKHLNDLVARADREMSRIDVAYLMKDAAEGLSAVSPVQPVEPQVETESSKAERQRE